MSLTEIPEEMVSTGVLFDETSDKASLLKRCDAIIYIFESNDAEQVEFVKMAYDKFKQSELL